MEVEVQKKTIHKSINMYSSLKEKHLRVAAYTRVSTEYDDQKVSLDSQQKYYNQKISDNPNWELVKIYYDKGITGTKAKSRPGFMELLRDSQKGKIDLILTKSVSRFARNTLDTLKYVRQLKDKGIAVYFEEENLNTMDMNGELLLTVLSSIAQQESINLSSHVYKGLEMKMKRGEPCGTVKCYGYSYDKETKIMSIIPEQAEIVKRMYNLYLEGNGTVKIAKILSSEKIKTPTGKNNQWSEEVISKILKNEKYKGDIVLGRYYKTDPITHRVVTNKGERDMYYVHDHHVPIVSKELWQQVNDEMSRREKQRNHKGISYLNRYAFSDKIKCGFCGNSMNRLLANNLKEPKYECKLNKTKYITNCENARLVSEEVMKRAFMQAANRLRNKIKLEHRFSDKMNEKIGYSRKVLINRDDIDIEKFEPKLFSELIKYMIVGGKDENGKDQPYLIRFIIKTEDDTFVKEKITNEKVMSINYNKLVDFYSNQTFSYFEKNYRGILKQKFVNRVRVQIGFEEGTE